MKFLVHPTKAYSGRRLESLPTAYFQVKRICLGLQKVIQWYNDQKSWTREGKMPC